LVDSVNLTASQPGDFRLMLAHEPVIEQWQVGQLEPHRQIEKAGYDCTAAAVTLASTLPYFASMAVDDVVVCNLITIANGPSGYDSSDAADRLDECVRVAARIDVTFRQLHQNYLAPGEIVAELLELNCLGSQGVTLIDLAGVVNAKDCLTGRKIARGEDTEAMDQRRSDDHIGHRESPPASLISGLRRPCHGSPDRRQLV
jgi:hypothetical protein